MQKDQVSLGPGSAGHRHDIEHAVVFTQCSSGCRDIRNHTVSHVGRSAHGDLNVDRISSYSLETRIAGTHPKLVYHQGGQLTHSIRRGNSGEEAENHTGSWHFPTLVTWKNMKGSGSTYNSTLRAKFNSLNLGSAKVSFSNSRFINEVNKDRPSGYNTFTSVNRDYLPYTIIVNPPEYRALKVAESGKCLDIEGGTSATAGANVQIYKCHGKDNQKWKYDRASKRLISKLGNLCLDVSGASMSSGTSLIVWQCHNSANQKFDVTGGMLKLASNHNLVVDADGTSDRSNVQIYSVNSRTDKLWTWDEYAGFPMP
jgi:hypothetical protein